MTARTAWPLFVFSLCACDRTYGLCPKVVACSDGEPIAGAQMEFSYDNHGGKEEFSGRSERDGTFCVARLNKDPPSRVEYSFSKEGYCPKSGVIENPPDLDLEPVCLEEKVPGEPCGDDEMGMGMGGSAE